MIRLSPGLTKKLSKSRERRSKTRSNKSGSLKQRSRVLDRKLEQINGLYQMKEEGVKTP